MIKGAIDDFASYIKKFAVFASVSLIAGVLMSASLAFAITLSAVNVFMGIMLGILGFIVFFLVSYMAGGAMIYLAKEGAGVKESLAFMWKNIGSYLWIMAVMSLVLLPAFIALIIPGLILSVFLGFSILVFMDEGHKGLSALARSKDYVKGYLGPIVGRFALYVLTVIGAMIVVGILGGIVSLGNEQVVSVLNSVFNLFIMTPIGICFAWRLYKDLKARKTEVSPLPEPKPEGWMKGLIIAGIIAIIAGIVVLVYALPSANDIFPEEEVNFEETI